MFADTVKTSLLMADCNAFPSSCCSDGECLIADREDLSINHVQLDRPT